MSKKTFTIIVILILIILGLFAWWFFSHENSTTPSNQSTQTNQNLFPYGQNATTSSSNNQSTNTNGQGTVFLNNTSSTSLPTLIHITTTPVSGMTFLPGNASSSTTTLRYIDRATGHIYDYSFDTGVTTEISNTTIPKVDEGAFSAIGTRVYLETLDASNQIETISAAVPEATTTGTIGSLTDVTFFPKNIVSIAQNLSSLFYLVPTTKGSAGYTSALNGTKSSQVLDTALSELISKWQGKNITLLTKASASAPGYFFDLNTKTNTLNVILHNIAGLTALENPTGTFVFGSASANGAIESFVYDEKKDSSRTISLNTLADKCVWSASDVNAIYCAVPISTSGTLPDDWYQGNVFLADNDIWKIAADTGTTNIIASLSQMNPDIDAENLTLDGKEKWLGFIDKEDLTLWALRIAQ